MPDLRVALDPGPMNPRQRPIRADSRDFHGRPSSSENDDSDPIALLSAKSRSRPNPIKLTIGSSNARYSYSEPQEMDELRVGGVPGAATREG